ncbi:MAG: sugar-transfer associated ATP-grasp domain-containing protein [Alphaproteobacteria bacterium]
MRQVLSYASQIARAVLSYYGSFWLPLLLTELVPLPAATRMQVRQYFRSSTADPEAARARDLKVLLIFGLLSLVDQRSRILRYVVGVLLSAALVVGPLIEIGLSLRANRRYAQQVQRRFGIGRIQQFVDMLVLGLREPETFGFLTVFHPMPLFYADWMFLPEQRRSAHLYYAGFPGAAFAADFLALKPEHLNLREPMFPFTKLWVHDRLHRANVHTVKLIAMGGRGALTFYGNERALPPTDLFAKPNLGKGGIGAVRWTYHNGTYRAHTGEVKSEADLLDHWRHAQSTVIVQKCLRNHPLIEEIAGRTLCTLRVHTVLDEDGTPRALPDAFLKLAAGSAVADNIHFGGLAVPVDMTTGELGVAINRDFGHSNVNPVTGMQFRDKVVPFWQDVLALALRGHEALLPAVVVGFDIAVLADGPTILEANSAPFASDHLTHVPMATIGEMDLLLFHLRRLAARVPVSRSADGRSALLRK